MSGLPEFYFRVREGGATVYRVDAENRQRRLELEPIAVANIRNDQIRAHGDRTLGESELAAIRAWMEARRVELAARAVDDARRTIDQLNAVAQWAQSKASAEEVDAVAEGLLLAMHDLRGVLVRRKAERLMRGGEIGDD
jgi:hypothetical protein